RRSVKGFSAGRMVWPVLTNGDRKPSFALCPGEAGPRAAFVHDKTDTAIMTQTFLRSRLSAGLATLFASAALLIATPQAQAAEATQLAPVPAIDAPAGNARTAIAFFAGGCFWGVEGVFSHVKGVKSAVSGYGGGPANVRVNYEKLSTGTTG